ncbi:MAG: sigma 54-interacting transcriptional regulator [Halioglobus sp.]
MRTIPDADLTLPSIVASLGSRYNAQDLVLTIIFHPDTARIGHRAVVGQHKANAPWILGRRSPIFHDPNGPSAEPLDDPYISRRALQFALVGKRLVVSRLQASSRCRFGPRELYDEVLVEWEHLRGGVPLLLGHSIVLLLRLADSDFPHVEEPESNRLLRGSSVCMAKIREQVARAADSDLDVLIRGETGTGKELVATAIHRASCRAAAPMVSVNMAAIPSELAASALFGSARGAYTGANQAVPGYFEQAQRGSLFLDEIGDTAADIQPQLLRALQEREIQAVGGPIRQVDVRVISATDAILDGTGSDFKVALRHRLAACEIVLPPLREHPEDIGELLLHFLQLAAHEAGRPELLPSASMPAPTVAAWAVLFFNFLSYHWPGNVRELANFAQQVVLASENTPVTNEHLLAAFALNRASSQASGGLASRRKMAEVDDATFERAMLANDYQVKRVAAQLGVSRAAVYRRIEASPSYKLASEIPQGELRQRMQQHDGDCVTVARHFGVSITSLRSRLRTLSLESF